MMLENAGSIYNIVDDDPASRTEVMAYARGLLSGGEPARIPLDVASEMSPQPPLQVLPLFLLHQLYLSRLCKWQPLMFKQDFRVFWWQSHMIYCLTFERIVGCLNPDCSAC